MPFVLNDAPIVSKTLISITSQSSVLCFGRQLKLHKSTRTQEYLRDLLHTAGPLSQDAYLCKIDIMVVDIFCRSALYHFCVHSRARERNFITVQLASALS